MDSVWLRFLMAVLATWRLGHLFARDNGPWMVFRSLRRPGLTLVSCFYCVTVWVAVPLSVFVVGFRLSEWAVCWLAIAGGAALLDRATNPPFQVEVEDDLLREDRRNSEHHHA